MFLKSEFRPQKIPTNPGVYIYRDRFGKVIYVGKAAHLRNRMSQYFQPGRLRVADSKLRSLINSIEQFEFYTVKHEDEALLLESQLIKEYMPRYNILLRDDKRFPLLRIDLKNPLPRLELCRFNRHDGAKYYGPFPHGSALRETMRFLSCYFKLRTCTYQTPAEPEYRHCLAARVKDCSAPCVEKVTPQAYRDQMAALMLQLESNLTPLRDLIQEKMLRFSQKEQFEKAAQWRDILNNLESVFGRKMRQFKFAKIPSLTGLDAVEALQKTLELSKMPHHIEGFDNSHLGGSFAVSSMVCFIDGRPVPKLYRRFKLRENQAHKIDDYAAMAEIVKRHYLRKLSEHNPLPDLILIDGGKGQLHAAQTVLNELGLQAITLISLAEKNEEVFTLRSPDPIVLERSNIALRLLQAIRDESHRFCITYNRALRNEKMRESQLDYIDGIGEERKKALLQAFGSIRQIKKATVEEMVKAVPGVGVNLAEKILKSLGK